MMNIKMLGAAFLLAASVGTAQAVTFLDFAAYADLGEKGVADGTTETIDGVDVTFYAYNIEISLAHDGSGVGELIGVDDSPYAYFDKGDAGVGVCQVINDSAQCVPSSDDNVTAYKDEQDNLFDEVLGLSFETDMYIFGLSFTDANHKKNFDKQTPGVDAEVAIGDANPGDGTIVAGTFNMEDGLVTGDDLTGGSGPYFLAAGDLMLFTYVNEQFYLDGMTVSDVPTPATITLLIAGLGMLRVSRKSQKAG